MAAPTPGQRVPALGDDGEGGRVPDRPARAGVRVRRDLATARARRRPHDDDRRRAAGAAPGRSQAAARLRHGEPARLPGRAVRRRHAGGDHGRLRADRSPTRCSRPRCSWWSASSTISTGTRDLRRILALPLGLASVAVVTIVVGGVDGRGPAAVRFRRQGGGVRAPSPTRRSAGVGLVLAGVVVGSSLTVAYASRFVWGTFAPLREHGSGRPTVAPKHVLRVGSSRRRLLARPRRPVRRRARARSIASRRRAARGPRPGTAPGRALAVWHGFNLALVLSLGRARRRRAVRWRAATGRTAARPGAAIPSGTDVYLGALRGLERARRQGHRRRAERLAADLRRRRCCSPRHSSRARARHRVTWPGLAALSRDTSAAADRRRAHRSPRRGRRVRRRFSAALFLGTTGYAMAGLFVVQGAPDLALTQVADRDAVDRAVRARPAAPARSLRAPIDRPRRRRCGS